MKKAFAAVLTAAALALCGCGRRDAYIDELTAREYDRDEIKALIAYEKGNKSRPDGGYVDVTGRTVAEVARERGLTLEEYLSEYDLPPDMPGLVSETEANYTIPVYRMAQMYDMSVETLKRTFGLPESVTDDTTWGEAIGEATLGEYAGEDNVAEFKKRYKLDDSVTADTKWKEIRERVDMVKKEQRSASE